MAKNTDKSTRRRIPIWIWILLALAGGLIAWFRVGDPFGDEGMTNVMSFFAFALAAIVTFFWFLLSSRFSRRVRFGTLLAVVLGIVGLRATVEVVGYSGSMVPYLRWKLGTAEPDAVPAREVSGPTEGEARVVDLTATGPRDFPGFLGATRAGRVDGVRLARDWEAQPPEVLWKRPVGAAWSGFAVVNGVAVTMEQVGEEEAVRAYDLATGDLMWSQSAVGKFEHVLGGDGPHVTPTIDGGRVYALGARGRLACHDGADGSIVWERDLLADFGISIELEDKQVQYGRSNSPLVVEGNVIVAVGGDPEGQMAGLVAYDKFTGEPVWEGPPRAISHSSPALARLDDVDQILIVNEASVSGHDPGTGQLLWEHDWPGTTGADANTSQPRVIGDDRVLVSKGYGAGAMLLSVTRDEAGAWSAEKVWHVRRSLRTKLTSAVILGDHAYGLSDGILECIDLATGKRVWKDGRYGHGQVLLVGELMLVLGEEGELTLMKPSPDTENDVLGTIELLDGKTWNTFALFGDHLIARNAHEAAAVRLPLASE